MESHEGGVNGRDVAVYEKEIMANGKFEWKLEV